MIESGESLSNSKKYCSVLEKIPSRYDTKQNEKHPLIFNKCFVLFFTEHHMSTNAMSAMMPIKKESGAQGRKRRKIELEQQAKLS